MIYYMQTVTFTYQPSQALCW